MKLSSRYRHLVIVAKVVVILLCLSSCRSYSPVIGRLFYSNDSLIHLNNVQFFINEYSKPLDTLLVDFQKEWSGDRQYYLSHQYEAIDNYEGIGVSYLYNRNNELISIIEGTKPGSGYIWLDDYLHISCKSYYWSVCLSTGKKKFIRRKGSFRYLGKMDNELYFESLVAESKIKCKKIKNKGSIIKLKNGRASYVRKEPIDSVTNLYYTPYSSVVYKAGQDFYILNNNDNQKAINYKKMFYPGQIKYIDGSRSFFLANDIELYKLTKNNIKEVNVFNRKLKDLENVSYMIKNDFMIIKAFSKTKLNESNKSLLYPDNRYLTFAIVNLGNKDVVFPFIKQ